MLPWWCGVAMALVFYLVLSGLRTSRCDSGAARTGRITDDRGHVQGIGARWEVPAANALPYWSGRIGLVATDPSRVGGSARGRTAAQAIDGMSWNEFEMLVGESFRCRGYRVEETGGGGPDGGVELLLRKGTERSLVQCKHWKASMVGVDVLRQLYGVMAARGATAGFVVTSGRLSDDAKRFAEGRNVELIDGLMLQRMLAQAKNLRAKKTAPHVEPRPVATLAGAHPECPRCASPMVRRKAARGEDAGREFWGCVTYPKCRGTRDVAGNA